MNKYLDEAILDVAKAEAIMYAYESAVLGEDLSNDETARRAEAMFFAIRDNVRRAAEDLDRLADDLAVVDAIYAVNDVQRTLKK